MQKFLPTCAETLEDKYLLCYLPPLHISLLECIAHKIIKETAPDVLNNLYRYGGGGGGGGGGVNNVVLIQQCFPPLVGDKMGLLGKHPITHLQGRYSMK